MAAKRTAWITAGAAIVMLTVVSRLRDKMHDELGPLGARVVEWADMARAFDPGPTTTDDTERVLVLNGQQIQIVTQSVPDNVSTVLAELEASCRQGSGDARHTGSEGFFLCLEELGTLEWPARFSAFGESHDVADLGPIRYVYVSERDEGALVVTMRPVGSFVLDDLVPDAERDVAGSDPTTVPRPEGGRRVLSAEERGQPYGITMYGDPRRSPQELLTYYRDRVDRERFTLLDLEAAAERIGEEFDEPLLYYLDQTNPGAFVVLHFESPQGEDSPFKSYVTVMEAR
ncbi:MAG: hypothetical protein H6724_03300 [Sandaracinus sp.]|nr:hypothetical protein [Sandaracinus sp.]MCB9618461.1 hypothetical protein [Sandaracinus sp.]